MNYILLRIRDILSVSPAIEGQIVSNRETVEEEEHPEAKSCDCGESRIRECNSICHWGDTPTNIRRSTTEMMEKWALNQTDDSVSRGGQ